MLNEKCEKKKFNQFSQSIDHIFFLPSQTSIELQKASPTHTHARTQVDAPPSIFSSLLYVYTYIAPRRFTFDAAPAAHFFRWAFAFLASTTDADSLHSILSSRPSVYPLNFNSTLFFELPLSGYKLAPRGTSCMKCILYRRFFFFFLRGHVMVICIYIEDKIVFSDKLYYSRRETSIMHYLYTHRSNLSVC